MEGVVRALVHAPLTENQLAALMSFSFNEGTHRLSDPACRIVPLLNAGDYLSAAGQFLHWTMASGKRILLTRRAAEVSVFLTEILDEQGAVGGDTNLGGQG
jgi:GH24 family phage-related lysozyme (muramidase)